MTVHPVASGGFSSAAPTNTRIRPIYARACIGRLAELARQDAGCQRVLDVGAGTGILTGQMLRARLDCVAAEPLPELAAQLRLSLPSAPLVLAAAESLPLPDRSFPILTSGRAFHWFDAPSALDEAARVLMPGGWLALAWTVRDESVPWVAALSELVESAAGGRSGADRRHHEWSDAVARSDRFEEVITEWFPNPVATTIEKVLDSVRSADFVVAMDTPSRSVLLEQVTDLLATYPVLSGRFDDPHRTVLHRARLRW